jgi:hypothetical protein
MRAVPAAISSLGLMTCLACGPSGATADGQETTTGTGDACSAPASPLAPSWTINLEALPEVEADELITGENSLQLTLPCVANVSHDDTHVNYTLECDHPDAGPVTIDFSIEASSPPPGFEAETNITLHIDASVDVGGSKGGPQALVAGHQYFLLEGPSGPVAVVEAGLGAEFFEWESLAIALVTDCDTVDPEDDVAGYYLGQSPIDEVAVEVGESKRLSESSQAEYELRVFQATIHGCCSGNEGSFALARIGG